MVASPGQKMKQLLVLFHSQSGSTERMANAVLCGARKENDVSTRLLPVSEAGLVDLLACDGILLGSAEYLGYLSGGMKDFFDRTYYPAQPYQLNLPYALFLSAGNDGRNAAQQAERILRGYPMRAVAEPLILRGEPDAAGLKRCEDLGLTLAAGLGMGIF